MTRKSTKKPLKEKTENTKRRSNHAIGVKRFQKLLEPENNSSIRGSSLKQPYRHENGEAVVKLIKRERNSTDLLLRDVSTKPGIPASVAAAAGIDKSLNTISELEKQTMKTRGSKTKTKESAPRHLHTTKPTTTIRVVHRMTSHEIRLLPITSLQRISLKPRKDREWNSLCH